MDVYLQLPLDLVGGRPSHCAFDQTVGVGLRSVYFGIFARVLEVFMPAEVCEEVRIQVP